MAFTVAARSGRTEVSVATCVRCTGDSSLAAIAKRDTGATGGAAGIGGAISAAGASTAASSTGCVAFADVPGACS